MGKEASEIKRMRVKEGSKQNYATHAAKLFVLRGGLGSRICVSTVSLSTLINNSVVSNRQSWREFSTQ